MHIYISIYTYIHIAIIPISFFCFFRGLKSPFSLGKLQGLRMYKLRHSDFFVSKP